MRHFNCNVIEATFTAYSLQRVRGEGMNERLRASVKHTRAPFNSLWPPALPFRCNYYKSSNLLLNLDNIESHGFALLRISHTARYNCVIKLRIHQIDQFNRYFKYTSSLSINLSQLYSDISYNHPRKYEKDLIKVISLSCFVKIVTNKIIRKFVVSYRWYNLIKSSIQKNKTRKISWAFK